MTYADIIRAPTTQVVTETRLLADTRSATRAPSEHDAPEDAPAENDVLEEFD